MTFAGLSGCRPDKQQTTNSIASATSEPGASNVPLRVWVAAPFSDPQFLMRQWLANSEQPLEFRSLTVDELLRESRCNCDILVYPAHLIGELAERSWIVKLPATTTAQLTNSEEVSEATSHALPAVGQLQATYASRPMGISLGNAVPVFIVSDSFPTNLLEASTWSDALEAIDVAATERPALAIDEQSIDRDAVVDRFLAIAATISERDPSYGLLFDLQTMRSRLREPEYLRAAKIFAGLASQAGGQTAALGSHSEAWKWAAQHSQPALAIAAPALIDNSTAALTSGQILRISSAQSKVNVALETTSELTATLERPSVVAWNTGRGLIASVSANCRQTNQAGTLLRWLGDNSARTALSSIVAGVEASTPIAGPAAPSWRARQALAEIIGNGSGLSHEPRLPRAVDYRRALADELILFLSGKKNAPQALQDADSKWGELTDAVGKSQRLNYEQSLNLGL